MTNREFYGEEVKTESSWAGPARILFITLILAGGFLYYYFGPRVEDIQGTNPRASALTRPISMTIGVDRFVIPENYTVFTRNRRGGVQDNVEMYAVLPSFDGYSLPRQLDFESNDPNSPVVYFSLFDPVKVAQEEGQISDEVVSERAKFERVYLPTIANPKGEPWRFGLTHYKLSDSWAGADEDLFVHENSDGSLVIFRCLQAVSTMPSPWCRRDTYLSSSLGLSYRFKRSRLGDWRDIDEGVMNLVKRFRRNAARSPMDPEVSPAPASAPTAAAPAQAPATGPPSLAPANEQETWSRPPQGTPGAPGPDDLRPEPDDGSEDSSGSTE